MKAFLIFTICLTLAFCQTSYTTNVVSLITQGANTAIQTSREDHLCINGYYWTGQSCMPCAQQSLTVSSTATAGYYKCTSYAGSGELVCNSGYVKILGSCLAIPTGCTTYGVNVNSNSLVCTACKTNYTLISGVCIPTNNCSNYNPQTGICTNCVAGYYFAWDLQYQTSTTNQWSSYYLNLQSFCVPCQVTSCSACTSAYTCSACATGTYWLQSTSNVSISSTSAQNAGTCSACLSGCATCTSNTTCTKCYDSYYLTASTGTTTATCTLCNTAVTNCATCSSATTCTTCQSGYYLVSATSCVPLGNYCLTASATVNCLTCQTNYLYDTSLKQCVACLTGCTSCSFLSGTSGTLTCNSCMDTYYGSKNTATGQVTCALCSSAQNSWLRCNGPVENTSLSAAQPTQCANGYYLVSTTSTTSGTSATTLSCISSTTSNPCLTAAVSSTQTLTCSTCVTNYTNFSGSCYSCPPQSGSSITLAAGCNQCTTSGTLSCTGCSSGYYFSGSGTTATCTACSANCTTCTSSGCTVCATGYFLNGTSCSACVANCTTCTSSTTCSTCATGFFLTTTTASGSSTSTAACYACQPGCTTCSAPGTGCSACTSTTVGSSAYILQNSGCVPLNQANCFQAGSSGCTICDYGFYFQNNFCLQCIQPYAGYVCNQTVPYNSTGTNPTVSNASLWSILILVILAIAI